MSEQLILPTIALVVSICTMLYQMWVIKQMSDARKRDIEAAQRRRTESERGERR